jgi:sec-independent protein translocase protein TatB
MFNVGPLELVVLAIVGMIVIGPDKLPGLARDAARMIRTLREMATGARTQLRDELGPEFADMDLRSLNPRTAIQRMVLGDDEDLRSLNPRNAIRNIFTDEDGQSLDPRSAVRDAFDDAPMSTHPMSANPMSQDPVSMNPVSMNKAPAPAQRPLSRGEQAPFDADAT